MTSVCRVELLIRFKFCKKRAQTAQKLQCNGCIGRGCVTRMWLRMHLEDCRYGDSEKQKVHCPSA